MTNKTHKLDETTEVNVMSNEQKKETVVKEQPRRELSKEEREEKKRLRRESMEERGRLTLSDEYKEPGYRYRVCNVLPGNIENWKSRGYEIVTHNMKSGSGLNSQPEVDGTPVEFEVGGAQGSMKAVWMRIREEEAEILDEIRDDKAREQAEMITKNPIPAGNRLDEHYNHPTIGKVTKEVLK